MQTHFVFRIFQVEHQGPVFVLVLAVGAEAEVEHLLFNGECKSCHLALSHIQIVAVTHPGGKHQTKKSAPSVKSLSYF